MTYLIRSSTALARVRADSEEKAMDRLMRTAPWFVRIDGPSVSGSETAKKMEEEWRA